MGDKEIPIKTYSGQIPKEQQIETVKSVLTEDFLVNDDAGAGTVGHNSPSVAMDGVGNFLIVWQDERNGVWNNSDIYFQRYNYSGLAQGINTRVNADAGIAGQYSPSIAMDVTGNFIIVWEDERNGNSDIYYQRYNSDGTPLGTNIKVNDDTGSEGQGSPSIAMDGTGNFVIVWKDFRNVIPDIYFQRYNSSGSAIGLNTKVNNIASDAHSPSVAMDGAGNFTIVFACFYNYDLNIYYQRYNSSGIAQGVNTRVNDDGGFAYQDSPSIVIDGNGNFVIVWEDQRNGNSDVYYQRYNISGAALGINIKVNDNTSITTVYCTPSVAMDGAGNFAITWRDVRNNNSDVYYQRFNSFGTAQGVNTIANDDNGTKNQWYPSIAMNGAGNFTIVWMDGRDDNSDVYYQRYNSSGTSLGVNIKANDDAGAAGQLYPSITMNSTGNFSIVWEDGRDGNSDIYYQRYDITGAAQGINTRVNDDGGNAWQHSPSIAMDGTGNFVIVWQDERNGELNPDIYYQRYNSTGTTLGQNLKVNEYNGWKHSPSIAMDGTGNFVIVWADDGIYYQRYDKFGTKLGVNTKVNGVYETANVIAGLPGPTSPSIVMDGAGNFVIVWMDYRYDNYDIYYQRYDSSGTAMGVNIKVNDDTGTTGQYSPSIAIDGVGNFVIVWEDGRYVTSDIYYQRYNSSGIAQGVNTRVNDDGGIAYQQSPSIAMDAAGNFAILWEDYRYGATNPDIIGQRYFANGNPNGNNYRIVLNGPNYGETSPGVAANNTKIFFSWMDNRRSKGWDIYGKIVGWDWNGVTSIESENKIPTEFILEQNYPNPFNPSTVISYQLPVSSGVTLKVYDILGNEIATLVDEYKPAGRYEVEFSIYSDAGRNLPAGRQGLSSGVYLYQLKAGEFIQTRKMILIK